MGLYNRGGVFSPRRRRRHIGRWIILALVLAVLVVGVYSALDNGRVVVDTYRVLVPNLPQDLEGFTVLHLSDLNAKRFGPAQKQLQNVLKNNKYHAVCITGDMVGISGDINPFNETLAAIDMSKPVFFIGGDSDPAPVGNQQAGYASVLADWVLSAQSRGAVYLGAPVAVQVGKATVWFSDASQLSLDLDTAAAAYAGSSTPTSAYWSEVIEATQSARERMAEEDLHIALSHRPLSSQLVETMQSATGAQDYAFIRSVDIILAGGTAGGQWRLPIIGPVWSDRWFPQNDTTEGFHHVGSLLQYVSPGLGTDGKSPLPDFRLFNTPQVTLLTFTGYMDDDVIL